MKLIFSILLVFTVSIFYSGFVYAEDAKNNIFIFVQTTVRNSDGQLLTYLESNKFTDIDYSALHLFLDFETSRGNDPIISIDNKPYQVIRRAQIQTFDTDNVIASTVISDNIEGQQLPLARFAHDGYPVTNGDTMESVWTFIRPV